VPPLTIKDLMGHKRIETTLRYCKISDVARNQAQDALNHQLNRATQPAPEPAQPSYDQLLSQVNALQQLLAQMPQLAAMARI
jgi:hypothetical protein